MGAKMMREQGVVPGIELYDTANFQYVSNLVKKDLIKPPYWIQFVMGVACGKSDANRIPFAEYAGIRP